HTTIEIDGQIPDEDLGAVPVAIADHGAVLYTDGATQDPATAAYLNAHTPTRVALGHLAAAADPKATPLVGAGPYATAASAAAITFPKTTAVGVVGAGSVADAVVAGPVLGE